MSEIIKKNSILAKEFKPTVSIETKIPPVSNNSDSQSGFVNKEKRKRFQIGDGYFVVKIDYLKGLFIGDVIFDAAPWRVSIAGAQSGAIIPFTANDATPNVNFANIFSTSTTNTGALDITDFLNGKGGQIIYILGANNTNKTTVKDAGNLHLTADWVENTDRVLALIYNGSAWIELFRV